MRVKVRAREEKNASEMSSRKSGRRTCWRWNGSRPLRGPASQRKLALELAQVKEERAGLEASIDRERANDSAEEAAEILDLSEKTD